MAAATAAALGSRLGVVGTIAGAAVLSVISAIAASLYTGSMARARDVVVLVRTRRGDVETIPTPWWRRPDRATTRRVLRHHGRGLRCGRGLPGGPPARDRSPADRHEPRRPPPPVPSSMVPAAPPVAGPAGSQRLADHRDARCDDPDGDPTPSGAPSRDRPGHPDGHADGRPAAPEARPHRARRARSPPGHAGGAGRAGHDPGDPRARTTTGRPPLPDGRCRSPSRPSDDRRGCSCRWRRRRRRRAASRPHPPSRPPLPG